MENCKIHLLEKKPDLIGPTVEKATAACKTMLRIRNMEKVLYRLYQEKKVRGFCHLSIGQEAISAGIEMVLDPNDILIGSYRCHAFALISGIDAKEIVCEQVGSVDGCSRGKGGSMHLYGSKFLGGHGIVGAQVPLGLGAAFAEKYKSLLGNPAANKPSEEKGVVGEWTNNIWNEFNGKNVTIAAFGDGAANQGQIYESMNMAALWKLPIVFLCENNQYGMGTPVSRASASPTIFDRFSFVPGIWIDSTDVFTVASAFKYAREHALKKGPIIIECATYRYNGHSMTDAFTGYRKQEEVDSYEKKDSIDLIKHYMGPNANRKVAEMNESAHSEMEKIKKVSINSPRCDISELYKDILI